MCSTDSWAANIVRIGVAFETVGFLLAALTTTITFIRE
jgi:hypothetical protein